MLNKPFSGEVRPSTSRTAPAEDDNDDGAQVSVAETKAKKVRELKARIMDLTETYNDLVDKVIARNEERDDLMAARNQLKQQERNIQRSRDDVMDTLEQMKQQEIGLRIKVKEEQRYANVLKCMRERQISDLMINKQIYERYDKLSSVFEIEVEDTQKEAIESCIGVKALANELEALKVKIAARLVGLERAVKDAKIVVKEKEQKLAREERERIAEEEKERQKAEQDTEASVVRKMEGKLVVQKTLQLKKHFEMHMDAFRQIWLVTGLGKESEILKRFHNQDEYVNEAQIVVRRLQLQVSDMRDKNEDMREKLNVAKYTSSQLESSTPTKRNALDEPAKQEDTDLHSEAWWRAELANKLQEKALVKKSWQAIQHSRSRVGQFAALLSWSLQKLQPDELQFDKPMPPLPQAHASEDVMEHMDDIEERITAICEWLLSDVVRDLIQRAREDSSVRFRYRHNPRNLRVKKVAPPPKKKSGMGHFRGLKHLHTPESNLINPLLMPLTDTDLDSLETERMRESVMSRKDMKNMSLARFRVCTPMQLKKDLDDTSALKTPKRMSRTPKNSRTI